MSVRYPNIRVKLTGNDGNAFMMIGRVRSEMRESGVPSAEIEEFTQEAMSGDYSHVIQTIGEWVSVR